MSGTLVPRAELGAWCRIRRYAVPRPMIEAATAARLAGDWRAACAAAGIAVAAGKRELAPFADELRQLVPDLLRWHMPRSPGRGETTIDPRTLITLARRGPAALAVATPRVGFGTQRLALHVVTDVDEERYHIEVDWTDSRHLWHAWHAGELVARTCGPNALTVLARQDAGRPTEAWAAAGVEVPEPPSGRKGEWRTARLRRDFAALDADPSCLLAAARATGLPTVSIAVSAYHDLRLHDLDTDRPRAEWVESSNWRRPDTPDRVRIEPLRRPVDLHLVRLGLLSPADLHPLIGPLLAPFAGGSLPPGAARPFDGGPQPTGGAAELVIPDISEISNSGRSRDGVVRVRCGGEWHEVGWDGGQLRIPHGEDERRREETLRALGGDLQGCFAAAHGWRDRSVRLPRRLEQQRRDLLLRAQHGDLDGVVALLDAGVDPHARDPHGRTLLHLLPCLDHLGEPAIALLGRLLAAGLDVDDRDNRGRTPLHAAVHGDGSPALVRALLDAGARADGEDFVGDSIADAFERHRQDDLPFLAELLL
ncbi:ankyrin repeat domain-containing protein [Dactylosporangium sp. NPDC048998]|uniref:ankyrin repeat domain-containing protein n=1 Tax=Dactylosporangium sp. NPDC048998 TaxID=3363976 RepID=UPI003717A2A6